MNLNMKQIFKTGCISAVLCTLSYSATAQTTSDPSITSIRTDGARSDLLRSKAVSRDLSIVGSVMSGSSGLNQYVLNRLAFGGYISPSDMEKAESRIRKSNRAGFYATFNAEMTLLQKPDTGWRKKWRLKPTGIKYFQFETGGAAFSKGAFQTVFRGNGYFLGETLNLGKSGLTYWSGRSLKVNFGNMWQGKTGSTFSASIGVGQMTSYRKLNLEKGSIFTEANRSYVDVSYTGDYYSTGARRPGGVGLGIATDLSFDLLIPQNKKDGSKRLKPLSINLVNFGLYQASSGTQMSKAMDSALRISQSVIGVNSLNTDAWISNLRDTALGGLSPDSVSQSKWVLAPFYLSANFGFKIWQVRLDYMYVKGYLPRLTFSSTRFSYNLKNIQFKPEFQFGGFDTYNLNLRFNYFKRLANSNKSNRYYTGFFATLNGIEGLILPKNDHGAGLILGFYYGFN